MAEMYSDADEHEGDTGATLEPPPPLLRADLLFREGEALFRGLLPWEGWAPLPTPLLAPLLPWLTVTLREP